MENQDYLSELEIIFIVLGAIGVIWGIVALKHICLKWEMCPCEKCVYEEKQDAPTQLLHVCDDG